MRRILLVISGSVAAYKALELTRLLRKSGAEVAPILTAGGARFVTKEALAGISGARVHDDPLAAEARSAISAWRAGPTWWWSRRPARTCWPRWRMASPTTWRPPCSWRPARRCWRRPR
jgi:hypothetical protein